MVDKRGFSSSLPKTPTLSEGITPFSIDRDSFRLLPAVPMPALPSRMSGQMGSTILPPLKQFPLPSVDRFGVLGDENVEPGQNVSNWLKGDRGLAALGFDKPSTRASSPRKTSASNPRGLPTPVSTSPSRGSASTSTSAYRLPPSFEHNPLGLPSSRYSTVHPYTPRSPYCPGEYGRQERKPASENTKIERKLFDDDEAPAEQEKHSLSLAPAFQTEMKLRTGASVDLVSCHFTYNPHQAPGTPTMSLIAVRRLLDERFPRSVDTSEISKAMLVAFPHSQWDYPTGSTSSGEPPMMRGLKWSGRVNDDDDTDYRPRRIDVKTTIGSRSPTQSTLVSPISSSTRRVLPNTPARSVLDEFAELATIRNTPAVGKPRALPEESRAPAIAIANLCNSTDIDRKRRRSPSPQASRRRRASTPDGLHDLLAAAEAVEGSPIGSVIKDKMGHKRRRTIGGAGNEREIMMFPRKALSHRGTISPMSHLSLLPGVQEDSDFHTMDVDDQPISPHSSDVGAASSYAHNNGRPSNTSTQHQSSANSNAISFVPVHFPSRKGNELPTQGDHPGFDCKPPHPYHELIRYAIENAPDQRLQLAQIYSCIADRFPFFKSLDEKKTSGWQNSIRHNLSLKKMFVRVNKVDEVPDDSGGKGGWWTVQPGVPDEGRPGRKTKAKRNKGEVEETVSETGTEANTSFSGLSGSTAVGEGETKKEVLGMGAENVVINVENMTEPVKLPSVI